MLSVNGNDAFLVADQNLDKQKYNDISVYVTWETCTMRSWLNGYGSNSNVCKEDYTNNSFISRAFTPAEQEAVLPTTVKNANNPDYGTDGGKDTTDKIFLLSYDEVTNPAYGFSSGSGDDKARERRNTAYVAAGGTFGLGKLKEESWWWLRSPGNCSYNAMNVYSYGAVNQYGYIIGTYFNAVCPALHLNLTSSDFWSYAGTVNSNGKSTECQHENTEVRERKEASCKEAGYTGDIDCSDCGAKIKGETIPAKGHQWDNGIITKQATEKEDAVKTFTCTVCGETRTEMISGTSALVNISVTVQAVTDASIAKQSSEDVKGAVFNTLLARTTKLTNKTITLKWKKVSKADGYKIYGNRCGKKNHYKLIKDVGKSKTSYTQKKLKEGTYYKYVVAAYKIVDGKKVTIAVSKTIHATTTGGKYGVAKSVKVNKSKVTLKKGKKFTIKAAEVKKDKTIKQHRKIAYESDNTKVATVSTKGVVKAKKKGSCYIYVYAQNGVYKRIKVTVK